jgi:hypothetical protein
MSSLIRDVELTDMDEMQGAYRRLVWSTIGETLEPLPTLAAIELNYGEPGTARRSPTVWRCTTT